MLLIVSGGSCSCLVRFAVPAWLWQFLSVSACLTLVLCDWSGEDHALTPVFGDGLDWGWTPTVEKRSCSCPVVLPVLRVLVSGCAYGLPGASRLTPVMPACLVGLVALDPMALTCVLIRRFGFKFP